MLRYLLDENQRGVLWHVIQRHNARGIDPMDTVRVGDPPDLPLGSDDPGKRKGDIHGSPKETQREKRKGDIHGSPDN